MRADIASQHFLQPLIVGQCIVSGCWPWLICSF
jgi:hypothetical protein